MTIERTAGETTVGYDPAAARLRVEGGGTTLAEGPLGVDVDGATAPDGPATVAERDGCVRAVHDGDLETTVTLAPADGAVDVTVSITNDADEPVRLHGFHPLADATTPFGPTDRVFEHGYQSWTPTATLSLDERFPTEPPGNRPQMCDLAALADERTSHYLIALAGDSDTVTLGFLDHAAYLSRFDLDTAEATRLSAVCPADGVALTPGETRSSAPLRIDATRSLPDALDALAATIGERMDARAAGSAPTGWCSWYHYFTDVSEPDIHENVDALQEWDLPVDVVQIDDGYETAFGDWRTLAPGFDDMARLREEITETGYTPGLWLAPFYVQADSELASSHPEWLVTDDGEPVDAGDRHGPMYGLDTTHPDVERWLATTFETIVEEWGFEYLKLDFLYAAALPGERYGDSTRASAYRQGLRTIREAVGEEVFVLGCGAPTFPSVGFVDAMRVGPDTAPYWRQADDPASEPAHENAVRNVLNRQFCHRRLWLTDPDCQLVRGTTDLTEAERRSFATVVALTGGANVFSDAIAEIDAAGRRLLERTLPPVTGGRVDGVGKDEFPDRLVCERQVDGTAAIAAFNWSDEPRTVSVDPAEWIDAGTTRTWSAFAGGVSGGAIERELPPHGVALAHCAPAHDRPHLLGARHLANAADRVSGVEWNGDRTTGTLAVSADAERPFELLAATPGDWRRASGRSAESDAPVPDDPAISGGSATWLTVEPGRTAFAFEQGEQG
ncbi:glycoside hydrolase family 36 protein [Halococcus agarilyticus]|uniref:glycoside hydrolase family 36 protein n=1 Tax=Halococcus agarilyticus TaxID=1232219 RepID=UPI000677D226|nr:glycoside hydrolase family 36 protein [Halococcus agarilyticus]